MSGKRQRHHVRFWRLSVVNRTGLNLPSRGVYECLECGGRITLIWVEADADRVKLLFSAFSDTRNR